MEQAEEVEQAEEAESPRRAAWRRDVAAIERAVAMVFTNRFREAEELSRAGAEAARPARSSRQDAAGGRPVRDLRSAYALHWTFVALVQGMASLATDQLEECLRRVNAACQLADEMEDWVGQRVIKGVSLLIAGVIHLLQRSHLRGGTSLVKAWSYICRFQEALTLEGYEAVAVRSFALFTLGVFNFVVSMLPPSLVRVASFTGGGSIKGDQYEAVNHLITCFEEKGPLAPWAAVALLLFHLSFKSVVGQDVLIPRRHDLQRCGELLDWAEQQYPDSGVFLFFRSQLLACEHDVSTARLRIEEAHSCLKELNMPALELLVHFRKGVIGICGLDWSCACSSFERSMYIYVDAGRRSWVPTLAYLSCLCGYLEGKLGHAPKMLSIIRDHRAMKKRGWPAQDEFAFERAADNEALGEKVQFIALLDLLEFTNVCMNSFSCLDDPTKRNLIAMLDSCINDGTLLPEDVVRVLALRAELQRRLHLDEEAFASAVAGVELLPSLNARGVANASGLLLHWTLALIWLWRGKVTHAQEELRLLERCPRPCSAYNTPLKLWKHSLRKRLRELEELGSLFPSVKAQKRVIVAQVPCSATVETDGFYSADEGCDQECECQSDVPSAATAETPGLLYRIAIAVHKGQEKMHGHTLYILACALSRLSAHVDAKCASTWVVKKRLVELRERLYQPVQDLLGHARYTEWFAATPFPMRGAPPGTTERLRLWCATLSSCLNQADVATKVRKHVLDFLEAH
eukprot:TRINITY_DN4449_c0_g1_i2.p1 TRINITY_DN4449_c0_g1~~TRINITY_DN4449_c0_g1_i2.p1  ORF type:complete len:744 (+),score=110.03 TRINITY_DN4449_c0_g1_i2:373-2604(+)